jgi:hypothetical protein
MRLEMTPARPIVPLVGVFGTALFTSAFLLFWIQPLFAKATLPYLGGTPAVWTTAMVFFQAALLVAYGYAHWSCRLLPPVAQVVLHGLVIVAALFLLPIGIRWQFDPAWHPVVQFMLVLTTSIGLPFFAIAATAPLLQRWFSRTGHVSSDDPYFLYGASNLGSVLALVAFPFVMEPSFRLAQQNWLWSFGFCVLGVLVLACALLSIPRVGATLRPSAPLTMKDRGRSTWFDRGRWIILAMVPSSLMLGVTAHITTDLAPFPLLWVVPLALYLVTYVIAFSRGSGRLLRLAHVVTPYALALVMVVFVTGVINVFTSVLLHLLLFFLMALVCHGELVRHRPQVAQLTEFYFFMSLGGVLGGLFNGLFAPIVFNGIYEYPIAIIAAAALRPGARDGGPRKWARDIAWPTAVLVIGLVFNYVNTRHGFGSAARYVTAAYLGGIAIMVFAFKERPIRYGLGVLAAFVAFSSAGNKTNSIYQERSFFGVYRVAESRDGRFRQLISGTTTHGIQPTDPARWRDPVSYYSKSGPLGQLFAALHREGRLTARVGVAGLGLGSTLCYARPGEKWTVFEIDPLVVRLARDTRYFHYWSECFDPENFTLRVGDARLTLQDEADGAFDFLMLDAYNSDAIPIHLMTREALDLYLRKTAPGGVIAFHISNRHLDLARVVAGLAADAGLHARIQHHGKADTESTGATASNWVVLARRMDILAPITAGEGWKDLEPGPSPLVWTDDYSNLISVLR